MEGRVERAKALSGGVETEHRSRAQRRLGGPQEPQWRRGCDKQRPRQCRRTLTFSLAAVMYGPMLPVQSWQKALRRGGVAFRRARKSRVSHSETAFRATRTAEPHKARARPLPRVSLSHSNVHVEDNLLLRDDSAALVLAPLLQAFSLWRCVALHRGVVAWRRRPAPVCRHGLWRVCAVCVCVCVCVCVLCAVGREVSDELCLFLNTEGWRGSGRRGGQLSATCRSKVKA